MLRKIFTIIRDNDLHLWVFTTGAIVLIIEIVALRILAPYFGNTLFSVSSVLSVVLLALSAGYWFGGNLADKTPKRELFYSIILTAGVLVLSLEIVRQSVLETISRNFSITMGPLVSALILFIGPAFLLGMLSPLAIKLKSLENKKIGIGRVTGGMFFWSTLGSISGSIAAGFVLIPWFGVDLIMLSIGITLIIMGATPLLLRKIFTAKFTGLFLAIVVSLFFGSIAARAHVPDHVLYIKDGIYEKIIITEGRFDDRPARFLIQDRSNSGASYVHSDEPVYDYTKYYSLYEIFDTSLERALVLGGGAYSIPRALLSEPSMPEVDVVEIEPSLYELSKQYFGLPESDRLHNHIEDGRRFLLQTEHSYDLIYGDVYRSLLAIPTHFTTTEFFELAKDHLTDDGVYVMNVIGDTYRAEDSMTFSEIRTFRSVFPNSRFYATRSLSSPHSQNIIMVGAKGDQLQDIDYERFANHPNPTLSGLQAEEIDLRRFDIDSHRILTDDHAPVDFLMSKLFDRRNGIPPSRGDQALAIVEQLVDYGPRYSGSLGNDRATGFIEAEINAHVDNVIVQKWQENGTTYTNVVGQIQPDSSRRIFFGTHYDSKQFADQDDIASDQAVPGANDSGSGVASLMLLAQVLHQQKDSWPYDFGVDFVFFDGEEGSIDEEQWRPIGSEFFATNITDIYGDATPEAAIVLDMVCERNAVFKKEPNSYRSVPELVDAFWKSGKLVGRGYFSDEQGEPLVDDHTALNAIGIPAIFLIDFEYPYFHTTQDTPDKCSERTLDVAIDASIAFVKSYDAQ